MTTLTINKSNCVDNKLHTPNRNAISIIAQNAYDADEFTFCEVCEQNIERWYNDTDPERLPMWTSWVVSK